MLLNKQKRMNQPTFINLYPIEYSQTYTTILLRLNKIEMLEVVILLMAYLTKYVFQIKQDLNLSIFNMVP